jgi:hypothetical protein
MAFTCRRAAGKMPSRARRKLDYRRRRFRCLGDPRPCWRHVPEIDLASPSKVPPRLVIAPFRRGSFFCKISRRIIFKPHMVAITLPCRSQNPIRADSRDEGESEHHPTLPSSICLGRLSPVQVAGLSGLLTLEISRSPQAQHPAGSATVARTDGVHRLLKPSQRERRTTDPGRAAARTELQSGRVVKRASDGGRRRRNGGNEGPVGCKWRVNMSPTQRHLSVRWS